MNWRARYGGWGGHYISVRVVVLDKRRQGIGFYRLLVESGSVRIRARWARA